MWKVAHKPFQRAHTFNTLDNWTSAVLSKLFLRSAVSFNKLFSVMGITKVDLLWEKNIFYFQSWTWVAAACAGGPRAAGLGSPARGVEHTGFEEDTKTLPNALHSPVCCLHALALRIRNLYQCFSKSIMLANFQNSEVDPASPAVIF